MALAKLLHVLDKQLRVQGVRMVEIELPALLQW
jgi:hypothetical protein